MQEKILVAKVANALVETAQINLAPGVATAIAVAAPDIMHVVEPVIERFQKHFGGLWVGGKVTLSTTALRFAPNSMNRAVQSGDLDILLPLSEIVNVTVVPAVLTNIVLVRTQAATLQLRCWGSQAFADAVEAAMTPGHQ